MMIQIVGGKRRAVLYVLAGGRYTGHMDTSAPRDHARLWRVEVFGGLDLLRASFVQFTFPPHAHEEFMIAVTESGTALPRFWGGVQHVAQGDVFVLSPGVVHSGGPAAESTWRYRAFYPPAALMRRVVQELTGADRGIPQFIEAMVSDPQIATVLRQAHHALEEPESRLAGESILLEALADLTARHATARLSAHPIGAEHHAVKLVKDYLEALPTENVSLETLAQEAGISPFRVCRVFRRETGLSPHAYQILVRVRLAKTLLTNGLPISQVAVDAGFFDQAHLTRHFKRIFGVTPGQYLGKGASQSS